MVDLFECMMMHGLTNPKVKKVIKLRKIKLVEEISRVGRATHATCIAAL